ncbi:MAG: HD domain-containing protein [Peptococcaceae bacterium]|nr:HD domain-containing protein [Peptococcaceae bacterium]
MSRGILDFREIFNSLSTALDFTYSGLSGHHKRVAYMAVSLAKKIGLPGETIKNLYISSIIHDIGAISMREKEMLTELEVKDPYTHSELGSSMVGKFSFLRPVCEIIKCHHHAWKGENPCGRKGDEIPLESRIINAVDRLDVLIRPGACILEQSAGILKQLKEISGLIIDPGIFAELADLAERESFWLDLGSEFLPAVLNGLLADIDTFAGEDILMDISLLFSRVIDHKSRFTHKHSRLVAAVAGMLARLSGFSGADRVKMVVAGLLHDLGKLSVPEEIIEKPGKLTPGEFRVMKRHTYFTHRILEGISGFSEINRWASFHHERLDGSGYPFRLAEDSIPTGSRIMAVSDVFSALAEDRPYRKGLPRESILEILETMSGSALDPEVVGLMTENFGLFEKLAKRDDPLAEE